jgi:hypothetical protein
LLSKYFDLRIASPTNLLAFNKRRRLRCFGRNKICINLPLLTRPRKCVPYSLILYYNVCYDSLNVLKENDKIQFYLQLTQRFQRLQQNRRRQQLEQSRRSVGGISHNPLDRWNSLLIGLCHNFRLHILQKKTWTFTEVEI